jgi:hypothetical protein
MRRRYHPLPPEAGFFCVWGGGGGLEGVRGRGDMEITVSRGPSRDQTRIQRRKASDSKIQLAKT